MATKPKAETPDFVSIEEAKQMFKERADLSDVRVQLDDGRIGTLSRHGSFEADQA